MIGFALAKNSVALHRHRRTSAPPGRATALTQNAARGLFLRVLARSDLRC